MCVSFSEHTLTPEYECREVERVSNHNYNHYQLLVVLVKRHEQKMHKAEHICLSIQTILSYVYY